ncbi:MAG: alpha-D-ribose 1-methylphosphonate 5-triphosphate diphosphatase [Alphaproteobacteria bacterium]
MSAEQVFTNARLVLEDRVVYGTLVVRDARIAAVEDGRSHLPAAHDLEGDTVIAGLVELHTDNLERHLTPRPGVRWPSLAALISHDAQLAAAGITTVFDAVTVGTAIDGGERSSILGEAIQAIHQATAEQELRADHFIHLRCEVSDPGLRALWETLRDDPFIRLVSLMDHTPGQRQFVDEEKFRAYYRGKHRLSDAEIDALIERSREGQARHALPSRLEIAAYHRARGTPLASHDDATVAHIDEAAALGCAIAEFPTTLEAAGAARRSGLGTIMGAPNLVRGGSHSGNIATASLAEAGLLDMLSSDYVPVSLLHGAFLLQTACGLGLDAAIATVTATPARMAGLDDRGRLAPGLRADFVRVRLHEDRVVPRETWCGAQRVA